MTTPHNTAHAAVQAAACPTQSHLSLISPSNLTSGAPEMQAPAAIANTENSREFLLELGDQAHELHSSHQALFALAQLVECAGNNNAVAAPHLATLMHMVGEVMASRTAQLSACIAAQQQALCANAAKGGAA